MALAAVCSTLARNTVLTVHSGAYPRTRAPYRSVHGIIFRCFSRLIAINRELLDVFAHAGIDQTRISVISPISLTPASEDASTPEEFQAFLDTHYPALVAVGGLEKEYDPLFQIASMDAIKREFPKAGLLIVGDGSMREEVSRRATKSACPSDILLAGNVDHRVTLRLIKEADVMLRTTHFDGDAISIHEALFLGTPVIATDNGMRPAGVRLIDIGDEAALIDELQQVLSGPQPDAQVPVGSDPAAEVVDLYEGLAFGSTKLVEHHA